MKKILSILSITVFMLLSHANLTIGARQPAVKAPGIALEDINGKFTLLSSLLSKNNIVLSFWSYDCAPCRKEMPELQQMADMELFKEKNIKLVFVYVEATTENSREGASDRSPKEKAVEVLQKLNIRETCLMDIYGVVFNNYRKANNISKPTMPLLFLINRNKEVKFSAIGYNEKNLKNLESAVKNSL